MVMEDTVSARFLGMECIAARITGEDTTDPIGKREPELCPLRRGLDKKYSFVLFVLVARLM